MGLIESVRGVLWARRRSPDQPAYVASLGHERFAPGQLLRQAVEAEEAGFDGVCCSDHLAPWWEPGDPSPAHCANAWVWLGAAGNATREVSLGTAVTGLIHRYNPVVVAQQIATLESLWRECADEPGAQAVLVTAPAGMGKSRLTYELLASIRQKDPRAHPASVAADDRVAGALGAAWSGERPSGRLAGWRGSRGS